MTPVEATPTRAGISCLLPCYAKDDPEHLAVALESLCRQARVPDEIVVVEDGPLPEALRSVLDRYDARLPTRHVTLPQNRGLGVALQLGLAACRHDLVARMDADDVARPERIAAQASFMERHPDVALVGSAVEEFAFVPGDLRRLRRMPGDDAAIRKLAGRRNPFNHMSVMFRREAIAAAGGYRHMPGFEDYDLWLRLLRGPGRVANLDAVLLDVRVGNGMLQRRRGWRYLWSELNFLRSSRQRGLISMSDWIRSSASRIPVRLLPPAVLDTVYRRVLRERT